MADITAFQPDAFQLDAFQIGEDDGDDEQRNREMMEDGRPPIGPGKRRHRPRRPMERIYPIDDEWVLALLLASPA